MVVAHIVVMAVGFGWVTLCDRGNGSQKGGYALAVSHRFGSVGFERAGGIGSRGLTTYECAIEPLVLP